jgi:peptidoglycan LD-endopeptidase LytH
MVRLLGPVLSGALFLAVAAGNGERAKLVPPIDGIALTDLRDTFHELRGQDRMHEAIDILSPRGTPVRAVVDGKIRKLFLSKPGGKTIYLFDKEEQLCYYYGHLDGYREGLYEGEKVKAGEVIGYVGSTGNADSRVPHLHMAIFELGPKKEWWKGTALNPYPVLVAAIENSLVRN